VTDCCFRRTPNALGYPPTHGAAARAPGRRPSVENEPQRDDGAKHQRRDRRAGKRYLDFAVFPFDGGPDAGERGRTFGKLPGDPVSSSESGVSGETPSQVETFAT
jgi:hypothetical protein